MKSFLALVLVTLADGSFSRRRTPYGGNGAMHNHRARARRTANVIPEKGAVSEIPVGGAGTDIIKNLSKGGAIVEDAGIVWHYTSMICSMTFIQFPTYVFSTIWRSSKWTFNVISVVSMFSFGWTWYSITKMSELSWFLMTKTWTGMTFAWRKTWTGMTFAWRKMFGYSTEPSKELINEIHESNEYALPDESGYAGTEPLRELRNEIHENNEYALPDERGYADDVENEENDYMNIKEDDVENDYPEGDRKLSEYVGGSNNEDGDEYNDFDGSQEDDNQDDGWVGGNHEDLADEDLDEDFLGGNGITYDGKFDDGNIYNDVDGSQEVVGGNYEDVDGSQEVVGGNYEDLADEDLDDEDFPGDGDEDLLGGNGITYDGKFDDGNIYNEYVGGYDGEEYYLGEEDSEENNEFSVGGSNNEDGDEYNDFDVSQEDDNQNDGWVGGNHEDFDVSQEDDNQNDGWVGGKYEMQAPPSNDDDYYYDNDDYDN